jgi:hypothetical protein
MRDQDETLGNVTCRRIRSDRWAATYHAPNGFITIEAGSFDEAIDFAVLASFLLVDPTIRDGLFS